MNIELKPIAESKVRQLGGDVCGVLVRTEDGVMAVSEHGRCTRLDAGVMGPVEPAGMNERELFEQRFPVPAGIYWNDISEQYDALPGAAGFDDVEIYHGQWMGWQAARAQGGQGADVVAWECSGEPGLYDNITRSKGEADHHRKIGRTVRPLVYGDTKPESDQGGRGAEAVAWASPLPDGTEQVTKELPERIYGVVPKDYQWYVRPLVYADTRPQPAVPEAKIIIDRVVEELENGFVVCERCGDQEDTATLDCITDLKRLKALLSTTTPQADGWVSMADRNPTKSDEDCEGKIWLLWPNRRYFERVLRGSVSCSPEFCWMPTGLKRPQPPKDDA